MQLMTDKKIDALLVEKMEEWLASSLKIDYPGKAKALHKPSQNALVKEIMSSHVVHVSPDDTIEHCMELVTNNHGGIFRF